MRNTEKYGRNNSKRYELFVPLALNANAVKVMGRAGFRSFQEYVLQALREKIVNDTKEQARGSKI